MGDSSPMEDKLRIEMLGAGQEVGRSCCVITFKGALCSVKANTGYTVVCDAGGAWR